MRLSSLGLTGVSQIISSSGYILFAFELSTAPLAHLNPNTRFEAGIQTEPFLAIVVAMIFSKFIPGRHVADPPSDLLQSQLLEIIKDAAEVDEEGSAEGDQRGIPTVPLQGATDAVNRFDSSTTKCAYVTRRYCTAHGCGRATYTGFL